MKKQVVLMAVAFAGAWMWAGVPLPNGYRAIESIDSTGRQWIDSGYVLRPDTKVECTVRIPRRQNDVSYLALFGACNKNSYDHALQVWARYAKKDVFAVDAHGAFTRTEWSSYPYDCKVKVSYANGSLSWKGANWEECGGLAVLGKPQHGLNTLFIFDTNSGYNGASRAEGNRGYMKLYAMTIADTRGVQRDFAPCRNEQGVAGLWDSVEGKFYASLGSANFIGGERFDAAPDEESVVVDRSFYGFELPDGVPLSARGYPYGARFEKHGIDIIDPRIYEARKICTVKELRWNKKVAAERRAAYEKFLAGMPAAPAGFEYSRKLAAYLLWSCCMNPDGNFRRETVLMSKRFMCNCWSWDHVFNAIALSGSEPKLAWDQFATLFDHQYENGYMPDGIGADNLMLFMTKPPIHGWGLNKMMERMTLTPEQLAQAYRWLSNWTKYWLTERLDKKSGLSAYRYGCDSGWDNSTAFNHKPPVVLPELQAFLVIQMEVLGKLAAKLGKAEEAKSWQAKSDDLLKRMFAYDYGPWSDSLIYHVTVILGHRMPADQRARYVAPLKTDRFLTEWGLASEALKSPKYEYNGYWQGPIWAPYTLLMIDGLRDMGETEFANDLARRFMLLFRKGGSAENFDPITGQGLRDLAYTWTSSVFLELMRSTPPVDR